MGSVDVHSVRQQRVHVLDHVHRAIGLLVQAEVDVVAGNREAVLLEEALQQRPIVQLTWQTLSVLIRMKLDVGREVPGEDLCDQEAVGEVPGSRERGVREDEGA